MTDVRASPAKSARRGFTETYGSEPSGVWFAPGRINIIGEHTDYNQGFVLPMALDRGVAAAAALTADGWVELFSQQTGSQRFAMEDVARGGPGLGHAESAVWAATAIGMEVPGLKVFVSSSVPIGSGLSSSSAFIAALLVAIDDLTGHDLSREKLPLLAQKAETDGVGVPIGVMDPMVSVLSRQGHAFLLDCQSLEYEHVPFEAAQPDADTEVLIVDTRTERSLVAGAYAERRRSCQSAADAFGVPSLRSVTMSQLEDVSGKLEAVTFQRARHVVTENARVLDAVAKIRAGDMVGLGTLLDASHQSLAEDFEVSSPPLDLAVEVCREIGAFGARLTGAGFGGCAIGLFPSGSSSLAKDALNEAFSAHGMTPPALFRGVSGPSAGRAG